MSNEEEKIYTQSDVDGLVAKFKRDTELNQQLIWALVQEAGGEIRIPYETFVKGDPERSMVMYDDPLTYTMVLRVRGDDV